MLLRHGGRWAAVGIVLALLPLTLSTYVLAHRDVGFRDPPDPSCCGSVLEKDGLQGGESEARIIQDTIQDALQAAGDACLAQAASLSGYSSRNLARYWSDDVPAGERGSLLTSRMADTKACAAGGDLSPTAPATVWDLIEARHDVEGRSSERVDWREAVRFRLENVTLSNIRIEDSVASVDAEIVQTTTWPRRRVTARHAEEFELKRSSGTWRIVRIRSRPLWNDPAFAERSTRLAKVSAFLTQAKWQIGQIGQQRSGPMVCGHPAYAGLAHGMATSQVRAMLGDPRRIAIVTESSAEPAHQSWEYAYKDWGGDIDIGFDSHSRVTGFTCGLG